MGDEMDTEIDAAPAVLLTRDETDPAVAVLTLNRPARYNALTIELKTALLAAIRELATQTDVRALVLTGAGKAFCVGQDLGEHADGAGGRSGHVVRHRHRALQPDRLRDRRSRLPRRRRGERAVRRSGPGLRAGLRPAGRRRRAEVLHRVHRHRAHRRLGAVGEPGARRRRRPGHRAAAAERALHRRGRAGWGLVRAVVPADEVLDAALALARRLAAGPTKAYVEVKRAVRRGAISALPDVLDAEGAAQARLATTRGPPDGRRRLPREAQADVLRELRSRHEHEHGPATAPSGQRSRFAARGRASASSTPAATTPPAWRTSPAPPGSRSRRSTTTSRARRRCCAPAWSGRAGRPVRGARRAGRDRGYARPSGCGTSSRRRSRCCSASCRT